MNAQRRDQDDEIVEAGKSGVWVPRWLIVAVLGLGGSGVIASGLNLSQTHDASNDYERLAADIRIQDARLAAAEKQLDELRAMRGDIADLKADVRALLRDRDDEPAARRNLGR